ncbi:hypothetical protein V1478_010588 [Vespula squamosa]|uniref:Uncharacterized protein n=1 Tax=Vespula squamosa TaxID=30214 RepID=A0ABD2AJ34_VESSQ
MNSNKLILRTTTWKSLEGRLNRRRLTLSLRSLDDDNDDDDDDEDDEDDNDDDEYSTTAVDEFGRASTNYISAEKRSREIPSDIGEAKRLPVGGRNGNGGA